MITLIIVILGILMIAGAVMAITMKLSLIHI